MPNWTPNQLSAIQARNPSLLIAAAAGSGKTAVLVERIVSLLREGYTMDRMMIVTFTRAAAAEMRERLTKRLTQETQRDPDVFGQSLDVLDQTDISTIHSFCQKVIRSEFQAVNVDPLARVAEEQQGERLFRQSYRDALCQLLEDHHPQVTQLASSLSQDKLFDIVQYAYKFLMSMPDPFQWLKFHVEHADDSPEDAPWYHMLQHHARLELHTLKPCMDRMRWLLDEPGGVAAYHKLWESDLQSVNSLLEQMDCPGADLAALLRGFSLCRAPSVKNQSPEEEAWLKIYQKQRIRVKNKVKDLADQLSFSREGFQRDMVAVKANLEGLLALLERLYQVFRQEKRRLGLLDFNDLEQFTLEILRQPELRQRLQDGYDHLFVDECQDVSAIQDEIIQLLHVEHPDQDRHPSPSLFMVGDVKQSIYRFRLADPTRFLSRMRTWGKEESAVERAIFLQQNFRSASSVLEGVNQVFRQVMVKDAAELDYLPEDELVPGAAYEETPPVEVHLIHQKLLDAEDGMEKLAAQVEVVVSRLARLLGTPVQEGDTTRPLTYRDVVILMPRVAGVGSKVAEMMTARGIPVFFDGADSYFSQREIRSMISLLQVVDNPLQDVPLLAALKGDPFLFTDEDLADIRLVNPGKNVPFHQAMAEAAQRENELGERCRHVNQILSRWRFLKETMGLQQLMWLILHESGMYAACGALPEGELRQANLRLLVERAVAFEETGEHSLGRFLAVVDENLKIKDSDGAKVLQAHENLVRIMTIHKSKGLEFPVVFVLGMDNSLNRYGDKFFTIHASLGVAMPFIHPILRTFRKTPPMMALSIARDMDERAERMRLLYVAMTRPKNRLILVGGVTEDALALARTGPSLGAVMEASSMMEWVLLGMGGSELDQAFQQEKVLPPPADDPMTGEMVGKEGLFSLSLYTHTDSSAHMEEDQPDYACPPWLAFEGAEIPAMPPWPMMPSVWKRTPLKTSVTSLVKGNIFPHALELEEEETTETKQQPEWIVTPLRLPELPDAPHFISGKEKRGAHRGTVIHRALSLLSLSDLHGLNQAEMIPVLMQQLDYMTHRGVFTPEERKLIPLAELSSFFLSSLGQRILLSPRVEREWGFNLRMPRMKETILQGVVDCVFWEDEGWVVVDYKTDHIIDMDAWVTRYREQLLYYKEAISILTNAPVRECILYSLEKMTGCTL